MARSEDESAVDGTRKRVLLADYAGLYAADLRTVKRWRADGRAVNDSPPFEDPEGMMAWWQRNKKLRIPPGIMAAVVKWRNEGKSPAGGEAVAEQKELPILPAEKDEERQAILAAPVSEEEIGMEQTLSRVAELEVKLSRTADQPGQTTAYVAIVGKLGLVRKALTDEQVRLGKLIPRDKAEIVIHEFHQPVEREIRLLFRAMCELAGLPATPDTEAMWNKECDRLFARFKEEVFR